MTILRSTENVPRASIPCCWCGGVLRTFPAKPTYGVCVLCGTYVNRKPPDPTFLDRVYSFDDYWNESRVARGMPSIADTKKQFKEDGRLDLWTGIAMELLKGKEGGSILEIGCAPGVFLSEMQAKGFSVLGIEPDKETAMWIQVNEKVPVVSGVFPDLPLAGEFDLIAGFDVFEHSYKPVAFMEKVRDLLRPDGYAVFQCPLVRPEAGYDREKPFEWAFDNAFNEDEHIFIFTTGSLIRLLKKVGLFLVENYRRWAVHHEIFIVRRNLQGTKL